jgi:hypothetical protein
MPLWPGLHANGVPHSDNLPVGVGLLGLSSLRDCTFGPARRTAAEGRAPGPEVDGLSQGADGARYR